MPSTDLSLPPSAPVQAPFLDAASKRPPHVAAFEANALTKTWTRGRASFSALHGIDLTIEEGAYVAITGASGSGKSTLLRILGSLDAAIEGDLRIFGQDARRMSDAKRAALRNRAIGFVFQSYQLLPHLTARENVLLPAMWQSGIDADSRADELLAAVGLADKRHAFPDTLSGGQQQRVAIARALLLHPKALLCDEPTGSLDSASSASVLALLETANAERGTTLVIATHDPDVVARAHRVIRLHDGRIVEDTVRGGAV